MTADDDAAIRLGRTAAERAAYRAFVRRHHPDVGGDPDRFVAGLAAFAGKRHRVVAEETDDARYDAPIVLVDRGRGLGRVIKAVREHRARRRRPPRVR